MRQFCQESGQKVNLLKSKIFFSQKTRMDLRDSLMEKLGISTPDDQLGIYLGMPIVNGQMSKSLYEFLRVKIRRKLSGGRIEYYLE